MERRKLYTIPGKNGKLCISEPMMETIILDVLKEQDDYFVGSEFITDALNDFYTYDDISLQKVRYTLNRMHKEKKVIMRHSIRSPSHKKYYSHPDNHTEVKK